MVGKIQYGQPVGTLSKMFIFFLTEKSSAGKGWKFLGFFLTLSMTCLKFGCYVNRWNVLDYAEILTAFSWIF